MKYIQIQKIRFLVQLICIVIVALSLAHVHVTAPYLMIAGILFGVFFCGWICPFGTYQEWIGKAGSFLKIKKYKLPTKYQRYAQILRYVIYSIILLGFTYKFLNARGSYSKLMHGEEIPTIALVLFISFSVAALFIDRPFCNYFCEKGAEYGLFSVLRIFSIKKDTSKCVNCNICDKKCPMNINVSKEDFVKHPNCINCFNCISNCPKKALKYTKK